MVKILTKREIRKRETKARHKEERGVKREQKRVLKERWKNLQTDLLIRDNHRCVFCNKVVSEKHFQSCHIIPWDFEDTRYDLNNLLLACFYHHKVGKYSMHQHPLWIVEWLKINRRSQYDYLITKMNQINNLAQTNLQPNLQTSTIPQ